MRLRLPFPLPRQQPGFANRVVVDGNKEIATGCRFRTGGQAGNTAVKVDFPDTQVVLAQGVGQPAGEFPIELEFMAPPGADCATILNAVANIDGNQRRRRQGERRQGQEEHSHGKKNFHSPNYPGNLRWRPAPP